MIALGPTRFVIVAGGFALLAAAVLVAVLRALPASTSLGLAWGLTGWGLVAIVGVASGVWLVRLHGNPGPAFLIAMATCMLSRLFLGGLGAIFAATVGTGAVYPYVAGLVAGFLPVQIVESRWFYLRTKPLAAAVEAGHPQPTERNR